MTALVVILLFIPCCVGIEYVINPFRFGIFNYENGEKLQSGQTKGRIPEKAKNVTIDLQPYGFKANYTISQNEINIYNDLQWTTWGKNSVTKKVMQRELNLDEIKIENEDLIKYGWKLNGQVFLIKGPRGSNGKGYDILYSSTDLLAIQSWSYW